MSSLNEIINDSEEEKKPNSINEIVSEEKSPNVLNEIILTSSEEEKPSSIKEKEIYCLNPNEA